MRVLLLFLLLVHPVLGQQLPVVDDEIILVDGEETERFTKLKKRMKALKNDIVRSSVNGLDDLEADVDIDLFKIQFVKFRANLYSNNLKAKEVHHNFEMVDKGLSPTGGVRQWNKFGVEAEVALPFSFGMPAVLGPVGLNFHVNFGQAYTYRVTSPGRQVFRNDPSLGQAVGDQFGETWQGIKSFRVPLKAEKIFSQLGAGSSIEMSGRGYVLFNVGVTAGVSVADAHTNLVGLLEVEKKTEAQAFKIGKKRYLRLTHKLRERVAGENHSGLQVGFSLFKSTLGSLNINGVLSVNLVSTDILWSDQESFVMDYTYDLDYPQAVEAFNKALRGDMLPTQALAVKRNRWSVYRGVTMNQKRTSLIHEQLYRTRLGIMANNSALETSITNLKLEEALGSFLMFRREHRLVRQDAELDSFYEDVGKLIEFNYEYNSEDNVFLNLAYSKRKTVRSNSQVFEARKVESGVSRPEVDHQLRVQYSYTHRNKNSKKGIKDEFIRYGQKVVGFNNAGLGHFLERITDNPRCNSKFEVNFNGILYEKSIDLAASYGEAEMLTVLGRFLENPVPTGLYYRGENKDQGKEGRDRSYVKWAKRLLRQFEKNKFYDHMMMIRNLNQLEPANRDEVLKLKVEKAKRLNQLFRAFEGSPFPFHFIAVLAAEKNRSLSEKEDAGFFSLFRMKANRCQYRWQFDSAKDYRIDDMLSNWDSY